MVELSMNLEAHTNGKVVRREIEPKWSLALADAEFVKKFWHSQILPGLKKVKEKDKRSGHWLPEHVRARVDLGHLGRMFCELHLIVPVNEGKPVGFVILRLYDDEFVNVPVALFAWITYCTEPRAMKHILPLVEKRAKEIGVSKVRGVTSRTAWLRRLRKHGYGVHQVIIEKDLE
jgi:hypothetical protein